MLFKNKAVVVMDGAQGFAERLKGCFDNVIYSNDLGWRLGK